MTWTAEARASVALLWGEGKSAGEIAKALKETHGITKTRNAVIGLVHRAGLSKRAGRSRRVYVAKPPRRVAEPSAPRPRRIERNPIQFLGPLPGPAKPVVKPRKFTDDPASRLAEHLLLQADSAERRRSQMQGSYFR